MAESPRILVRSSGKALDARKVKARREKAAQKKRAASRRKSVGERTYYAIQPKPS